MPPQDTLARELYRAVEHHDTGARARLMGRLHAALTGWLRAFGCHEAALEPATADAWALFWRACTPGRLALLTREIAIRRYLHACARAVSPPGRPRLAQPLVPTAGDDREQLVASLHYGQHLTAAEICAAHPDLFPTEADVWQTVRAMLGRARETR
jgi:hypothetical protein